MRDAGHDDGWRGRRLDAGAGRLGGADRARLNLPLKVLVGADYREAVLREAETVKALFARHPWSSR